jgi:hypothetical protein
MIGTINITRSGHPLEFESGTDLIHFNGIEPDPLAYSLYREVRHKNWREGGGWDYWHAATLERLGIKRGRSYSVLVSNRPHVGWLRLRTERFGVSMTTWARDERGRKFNLPCVAFLEWLVGVQWKAGRTYSLYIIAIERKKQ